MTEEEIAALQAENEGLKSRVSELESTLTEAAAEVERLNNAQPPTEDRLAPKEVHSEMRD